MRALAPRPAVHATAAGGKRAWRNRRRAAGRGARSARSEQAAAEKGGRGLSRPRRARARPRRLRRAAGGRRQAIDAAEARITAADAQLRLADAYVAAHRAAAGAASNGRPRRCSPGSRSWPAARRCSHLPIGGSTDELVKVRLLLDSHLARDPSPDRRAVGGARRGPAAPSKRAVAGRGRLSASRQALRATACSSRRSSNALQQRRWGSVAKRSAPVMSRLPPARTPSGCAAPRRNSAGDRARSRSNLRGLIRAPPRPVAGEGALTEPPFAYAASGRRPGH